VRYPDLCLDPLDASGASERDAALAHAIYDACVRRWLTIRHLARGHLRQPWERLEPAVVGALLGGAAQLLFFDRVPAHAALDESVEWVKGASPRAAGLVNAVLRRIASMIERDNSGDPVRREAWTNARDEIPLPDGRALRLIGESLPAEPLERAAAATGVPLWQVRRWAEDLGEDDALHVAWHAVGSAPVVLNVASAPTPPQGPGIERHAAPGHRVFTGTRPELLALLAADSRVWVQDAASAEPVATLGEAGGGVVVDLCAGRGTKTRQLLARFPDARVVACEVSEARLGDLTEVARAWEGRLEVRRPEEALSSLRARCGVVVADVPCSNSGVLARRVEARHRCSARQLARLNAQQREIVASAAALLGPGGSLLYSTCSLEREENADVVAWACRELGLELVAERLRLPEGGPGRPAAEYRDGGFAALLRRPGVGATAPGGGLH